MLPFYRIINVLNECVMLCHSNPPHSGYHAPYFALRIGKGGSPQLHHRKLTFFFVHLWTHATPITRTALTNLCTARDTTASQCKNRLGFIVDLKSHSRLIANAGSALTFAFQLTAVDQGQTVLHVNQVSSSRDTMDLMIIDILLNQPPLL